MKLYIGLDWSENKHELAGVDEYALVKLWNDFLTSAGIVSSGSAFAALSHAASRAAGLDLDERQLSILAGKGSGSACRCIPDGFAEWVAGTNDGHSYARQVAPPDHWDIRIFTVIRVLHKGLGPSNKATWSPKT